MKFFRRGSKVESPVPAPGARKFLRPRHASRVTHHFSAFTLIEIMIVVAIIGLVAAMGLPYINTFLRKEGLRKAVSDLEDVCSEARSQAIFHNEKMSVVFHPAERRFEVAGAAAGGNNASSGNVTAATLPDGVELEGLGINLMDFTKSDWGRVFFYPNGTSDEMTVVLHAKDQWRKITLEFSTGMTSVSDVNQ